MPKQRASLFDLVTVKAPPTVTKQPSVLFLDTGMHCGFALLLADGSIESGCWELNCERRWDSPGMRVLRFTTLLAELHKRHPLDLIAFEEVRRHRGVDAAHSYGGLTWTLMGFAETHKIPFTSIPVSAIKKEATGKGGGKNADKAAMCAAAKKRWPHIFTTALEEVNDNQADACWGLVTIAKQMKYWII